MKGIGPYLWFAVLLALGTAPTAWAGSQMPDVRAMPYQYFVGGIDACPAVTMFRYENEATIGIPGPAALAWYKGDGGDRKGVPFAVITTPQLNGSGNLMFIDFDRDGFADEEGPFDDLADKYGDDICVVAEKVN